MFSELHTALDWPKTEENILQLKLLQNALTEHLVFANRLCGLKVDLTGFSRPNHTIINKKFS